MKTKKYHFGKRWAIMDIHGWWLTPSHSRSKDVIDSLVFETKDKAESVKSHLRLEGEIVAIKETVYVVEIDAK